MKTHQIIFAGFLSLLVFAALPACGYGNEGVDTAGLSQVTLRIEGMA